MLLKILIGIFVILELTLFFGGIVIVMVSDDWGGIVNGYVAILFSVALVWAVSPAFIRR